MRSLFRRKAQKETDFPSMMITTFTGYVHYSNGIYSISSRTQDPSSYEQHYDRTEIVELTQTLMSILIASGMKDSELKNILMEFFKEKEEGEQ